LNYRNETRRRVVYAVAMLTGVAPVASQLGCDRPQAMPQPAGSFPSSRWPLRQGDLPTSGMPAEEDRTYWWLPLRNSEPQGDQVLVQKINHEEVHERQNLTSRRTRMDSPSTRSTWTQQINGGTQ